MQFQRFARFLTLTVTLLATTVSYAQLEGKLAERPIGLGYARNLTPERTLDYAKSLTERLEIGQNLVNAIPQDQVREMRSKKENPLSGIAWYMFFGLLPSFESVTFHQVVDEPDAKRMLQSEAKMRGPSSSVTGSDGKYTKVNSWSSQRELPAGQDPPTINFGSNQRAYKQTSEVFEKDGKRFVKQTMTNTELYRYEDGFLFGSNFEELHTMVLPTANSFGGSADTANDMGAEVFADRIPQGIKLLAWNMLNSTVGTQMQQRDNENQESFLLRSSAGELGLAAVKASIFELEHLKAWLKFASPNSDVLRAECIIETRRNSQLGSQLEKLAKFRSRFAPLVREKAAVTIHGGMHLPEDARPLFDAGAAWLERTIKDDSPSDSERIAAATQLGSTIREIGSHGNLELFARVGWSEASGGGVFGGIQVDENPQLLKSLHYLMTKFDNAPAEVVEKIQLVELSGQSYIRVELPAEVLQELQHLSTTLKLTHIYLSHQNSCLWFAVGGEASFEAIRQLVDRIGQSGLAAKTNLLTLEFDAEQWLSYPQDDESGIPGLLLWLDANASGFPPSPVMIAIRSDEKPEPLLQKVFDLGGARHVRFHVDADDSGIIARMEMGEAIANYYVARAIGQQDRMISRSRAQAAEASAKKED